MYTPMTMEQTDSAVFDPRGLTLDEAVLRHQLNILHYWSERATEKEEDRSATTEASVPAAGGDMKWSLLGGVKLHPWQIECRDRWFSEGRRGVVKVVTGAGKTILACAIIERLRNDYVSDLRVAVVVPTVVLLDQWYDLLTQEGSLPKEAVGRLGGGYTDALDGRVRILVCVLNSAAAKLPRITGRTDKPLLLVVDECHRAGAEQMSQVFSARRDFALGLSATPERDDQSADDGEVPSDADDAVLTFEDSIVGQNLGPIIYELDYRRALEMGILSRFTVHHHGLPLESAERLRYERLSRDISDLRRHLQSQIKGRVLDGGALVGWARRLASRGKSALAKQASDYVQLTGQRKLLLYHARARAAAVRCLVRDALAEDESSRIILFHESIAEVMRLFSLLKSTGVRVVAEHSQLADSLRDESIRLFRRGAAGVLVSARSLIEGFDVPAADVGIIVASSSSVRQRVQTLGRILRKKAGEAANREAVLHVLYMAQTTDELIYEKQDWEQLTGAERNRYFVWDPTQADAARMERPEPPRRPKPREDSIDWSALASGDPYGGAYEGDEFTCDSSGNVRDSAGRLMANVMGIPDLVKNIRGAYGRFLVTPKKRAVLVARKEGSGSEIIFAGFLPEPFQPRPEASAEAASTSGPLQIGDEYPHELVNPVEMRVQSKADGPILALRRRDGQVFARTCRNAEDSQRGADAEAVVKALMTVARQLGVKISKAIVDRASGTVICEAGGRRIFLHKLSAGLEFVDEILEAP